MFMHETIIARANRSVARGNVSWCAGTYLLKMISNDTANGISGRFIRREALK